MKKVGILYLNLLLIVLIFLTCKTTKKTSEENVNNTIMVNIAKQNTTSHLDFLSNDSTMLCFTDINIIAIKKQIPADKINCLDFENNWSYKTKSEITYLVLSCMGSEKVVEYMKIFETNSLILPKDKFVKEKTENIINSINTDKIFGNPQAPFRLRIVDNIPEIIQQIFTGFPLFITISIRTPDVSSRLFTVYDGEIVEAFSVLNLAYNINKKRYSISLENRIKAIFLLIEGINSDIKAITINSISDKDFSHYCFAIINDNKREFYLLFEYDRIYVMSEIKEKRLQRYIPFILTNINE